MPLSMDLNTVNEILQPANADAVKEWQSGYAWLAGGTWLFSEPQIATHTLIDLESFKVALAGHLTGGTGDRRDLQGSGTRSLPCAAEMESGAAFSGMLPGLSCFIQNLERSDRRRKRCHVPAGRTDDFPYGGAGGHLHALAAQRNAPQGARSGLCHGGSRKRPRSWRIIAFDLPTGVGVKEELCVSPFYSYSFGTFGGFANRHSRPGARGISPDRHSLHASPRTAALQERALPETLKSALDDAGFWCKFY